MSPPERLAAPYGRRIDRKSPISFSFNGKRFEGYAGDTVATALWAAGVRTIARSFKYHRPRGIFSLTGLDGFCLVQNGAEPNRPADKLPLEPDMPPIEALNYFGSLEKDRAALLNALGRFLPVGFYYRTFFRPKGAWAFFEPFIRKLAGYGKLTVDFHHAPQTDKQYLFCDVAVIGGGPAGLAAAKQAAAQGASVILIESEPELGGAITYTELGSDLRFTDLIREVEGNEQIKILTSALCQGYYADNWLAVEGRERFYKIRAGSVIMATGAFEQPLVFRNNDLPGIMASSAARRLIHHHGIKPGRTAVVCTVNDDGLHAALDLLDAGVGVAAVADMRGEDAAGPLHQKLAARGVSVQMHTAVSEALPKSHSIYGAELAGVRLISLPPDISSPHDIACDLLCVSGGWVPAAALACHAGAALAYGKETKSLSIRGEPEGVTLSGSLRGIADPAETLLDGKLAGSAAAARIGFGTTLAGIWPVPAEANGPDYPIIPHPDGKEFVDFDEDLTIKDIQNAIADGFSLMELLKRYSTAGMGPSQGKFSALGVVRIAARTQGIEPESLGTTTVRPPFTGENFRLLAGQGFSPYRRTPMHERHLALGAQMMVAGLWHRPAYYGTPDRATAAIREEVRAVRTNVGLIDVSTLGGIEVSGPDAAAFINRIYATPHLKQPVGRSRYTILCDDAGAIVDDGVACRLGENRFYLTATTGNVDATYRKFLWLNAQWRMAVDIMNMTGAFAAVNIAGPESREVLSRLKTDIDLSAEAFPYIDVRTGEIEGIPARVIRVGFVGELGYEIHVPMPYGGALWDAIMTAGKDAGIRPFGVEAQRVLRLEKGHVIVGQDSDGLTHPYEIDYPIPKSKTEYLGRVAIETQMGYGLTRKLVGFRLDNPSLPAPPECCLVIRDGDIAGRVTSAVNSEACSGVIGLAFVAPEDTAVGSQISIKDEAGRLMSAHVVELPFYDPANERQAM